MSRLARVWAVFAVCLLLPTWAFAQGSSITGVVKDVSGAVMPGVTVEAASPALIEKVKSAVSDGNGQYRIIDLRPGTYTVTFTLTGFNTVKRDGFVLPGDFVATINADLQVGALEETITVSGESPIIDITSIKTQQRLDSELLTSIPSAQGPHAIMLLMPQIQPTAGVPSNVQLSPGMVVFGNRGGRPNNGQIQYDGLGVGAAMDGGGNSGYGQIGLSDEVVFTTTPGLGEAEGSGPIVNMIPKTGSNVFRTHLYASGMSGWMQASNYTQAFADAGLRNAQKTLYLWENNGSLGGPIVRDRVWFFFNLRQQVAGSAIPGTYFNKNAGDPTKWLYDPDTSRPTENRNMPGLFDPVLRLTIQPTLRDKLNLFRDEGAYRLNDPVTIASGASPETGTVNRHGRSPNTQIRWTQTSTSRLLLDAGIGLYQQNWNGREQYDNDRSLIRVVEQCSAGCANNGGIQNFTYRAQNWTTDFMAGIRYNASATYLTGGHNFKAGYQGALYVVTAKPNGNDQRLEYRVNNGIPNQLTQTLFEYRTDSRVRFNALYVQDQWTVGRMTLQAALRYDHAWSFFPEQQIGPTRFLQTPIVFPETPGVRGYNDITPRFGLAYDLFGNGKTALKFSMGRYLDTASGAKPGGPNSDNTTYASLLPASLIPTSVTRSWTDANGNYAPDCDLTNGAAQDLRSSGGDQCGAWSNQNFGKDVRSLRADDKILHGWGIRPADWDIMASIQHELFPRVGVSVDYVHRWLLNFPITVNAATPAGDFTQFSITAPLDPRLPGGGGYIIPGIYDVAPAKFGVVDNVRLYGPDVGSMTQVYNGLDVNVTARPRQGVQLQGGMSTGQRVTDYCDVRAKEPSHSGIIVTASEIPVFGPTNPWCHNAPGRDTRFTALGTYLIPKIDVQFSGTMRSDPGRVLQANWTVSSAQVQQWLGRPLSGNAANITVNLLEPGKLRADRVNELDFRVAKILAFGKKRANIALDVFNALNLNTVIAPNQAFIPNGAWLTPTSGWMTARTAKITVQFDF